MDCLRCGKETVDAQFFCAQCLEDMKQYPIKPGTPVHITPRPTAAPEKRASSHKRELLPQEVVLQYRRIIVGLTVTIALLCIALCVVAGMLLYAVEEGFVFDIFNSVIGS